MSSRGLFSARRSYSQLRTSNLELSFTGQVVVELLLILPVFMLIVFFIMEIGHLAFQTIVIHHAAYEMARIGSLVAGPSKGDRSAQVDMGRAKAKMESVKCQMFKPSICNKITLEEVRAEKTTFDRQADAWNEDLLLTVRYPVKLIFPGTGLLLSADPGLGSVKKSIASNTRVIFVNLRMPIEKPFFQ
ncbi:MAG: pilus assembly protein [Elusimicrobia bacterium]|nr:pilus assembly protein [Elusimicrobiota bacterium]